jgi:DNA-binding SARP family transcriptional activator/Tfp pilus assembly protein PilF
VPDGAVEFRVLGPVEVWVRGRQVAPSAAKPRAVLAALVLNPNRLVPAEQLIDVVWGTDAPRTAVNTLQVYVSRLRSVLAAAHCVADDVRLEARSPGYLLRVDPQRLDVCRFRHLVAAARAEAAETDHASALYREALGLWRGRALADVASDRLRTGSAIGLEDEQLTAMEEWLELEIARGRHAEATSLLQSLVAAHPYRERLRELLMRAMHGSGRRADALAAFRAARATFSADLGIEPGPRLGALHRHILTGKEGAATGAATGGTAGGTGRTCRDDLPRDLTDMTGRAAELGYLLDRVRSGTGGPAGTVAIDGMAGVGKTTLAVHLAHLVAEHFSVRLFVDLRGHTAGEQPTEARSALGVLLRAVGVPDARLPDELDARAALWRAELAGRRALLVLDNAASTAQVNPLLPGGADCLTLVTSRVRLVGLESAVSLSLDVPPAAEAAALLRAVVNDERATADAAIEDITRLCGRLPLAIRVAGARLRHRAAWSPAYLASRLRERQRRLAELTVGDRSVAAAFAVSYDHLDGPQRRLFRLIGLVPGADLDRHQAAVLAGADEHSAEAILEELVDANLVTEPAAGRYAMHDLLREYARSRADAEEPHAAECLTRLLGALVHTASEAAHLLEPLERCTQPPAGDHPRAAPPLGSRAEAAAWLAVERRNLVAAVRYAADAGLAVPAWQLADALWHFCYLRGYTDDWITTHRVALAAARAAGDRQGESVMATNLGYAYRRRGRLRDALALLRRALAIHREIGDRQRAATTLGKIGTVYESLGMTRAAAANHRRALSIRREIGDRRGEGNTLNNLAALLIREDRHDEAIAHYQAAIAVFREVGDRTGEGRALSNLGEAYTRSGCFEEALRLLSQALALRRECGDRRGEANTLGNLGNLYRRLDQPDAAIGYLERALAMMHEFGDAAGECEVLNDIGAVLCSAGRRTEALARFTEAMVIAEASHMRYEHGRAQDGLARAAGNP